MIIFIALLLAVFVWAIVVSLVTKDFDHRANPLGNWWQPEPPDGYHPTWPRWIRLVAWHVRNPGVNFFSVWIGFTRGHRGNACRILTLMGLATWWSNTGKAEIWRDGGGLYLAVFVPDKLDTVIVLLILWTLFLSPITGLSITQRLIGVFLIELLVFCPYVSYRGRWVEWYLGWQPAGDFGLAIRPAFAKQANQTP